MYARVKTGHAFYGVVAMNAILDSGVDGEYEPDRLGGVL